MYMSAFMGMEFVEGNVVVLHFLHSLDLAEEYVFETERDATRFYMSCLGFCEELAEYPPLIQTRQFRKFLKNECGHLKYRVNVY